MVIYSGGVFFDKLNNVKYEQDTVMFVDNVKFEDFNRDWFEAFAYMCGDFGPLDFYLGCKKAICIVF